MAGQDFIIRFTDPVREDGTTDLATFAIKPFTVNGPKHPSIDSLFVSTETGTAISQKSPIVLMGKGIVEYGEQHANNWLQLAENFAGASAPKITSTGTGTPLAGVTWFRDQRYWVQTSGAAFGTMHIWNDSTSEWDNITAQVAGSGTIANRGSVVPSPTSGDYYYATDEQKVYMYYEWLDFDPTVTAWLEREVRVEDGVSPSNGLHYPRRTLAVYDPTITGFSKLLSQRGNDAGEPIEGELHVTGNMFAADPTTDEHVATKSYVDTEITNAVSLNNELHELLDVDAGSTNPPADGNGLFFNTGTGLWEGRDVVAADVADFNTAVNSVITAASFDDLTDVDLTGLVSGNYVSFDGTNWVPSTPADTYLASGTLDNLTGDLTLTLNDATDIVVADVASFADFQSHLVSTTDHTAADIDWTGAFGLGSPDNVEQAIQILESAITASTPGYTSFVGTGMWSSGSAYSNSGETTPGQIIVESMNSLMNINVYEDHIPNGTQDTIQFTINENLFLIQNMSDAGTRGVDHTAFSITGGEGLSGGGNFATTSTIDLDIDGLTINNSVDAAADYFVYWDASAGAHRRVLGNNLPGVGSAAYTTIAGTGAYASGSVTATTTETLNVSSANSILTITASPGTPDTLLFTINQGNLNFSEVVDDTTPQLGGNLDVNGFDIVSASNGNIELRPNGTGVTNIVSEVRSVNGTAALPAWSFTGDTDSGMYLIAGGTVGIATAGVERLRVNSSVFQYQGNTVWHTGNDGPGSGLNADLLDGQQGSYYLPASSYTATDVRSKLLTVDGPGSGIDADTLDGYHAADLIAASLTTFTHTFAGFGTNGATRSIAHGQGSVPISLTAMLVNVTAEEGYTAGDVVAITSNGYFNDGEECSYSLYGDTTQLHLVKGNYNFTIYSAATGNTFTPTPGQWNVRITGIF